MTFKTWVDGVVELVNTLVLPAIVACAFAVFVWGVVNYFFIGVGDEEKQKKGRQFMFWGILGLALLFSVWGVVYLLLSTFGLLQVA